MHHQGAAVPEQVRLLDLGLDVVEAVAVQLQLAGDRELPEAVEVVGARVVAEAGQGQLAGVGAAPDVVLALDDGDAEARPGQIGGARQPVVSRSDDDDVGRRGSVRHSTSSE